jgi:hypothetical protein
MKEGILGGVRYWFGVDAAAFLSACEGPAPDGYRKVGSGGTINSGNLFIDYFVARGPAPCVVPLDARGKSPYRHAQ